MGIVNEDWQWFTLQDDNKHKNCIKYKIQAEDMPEFDARVFWGRLWIKESWETKTILQAIVMSIHDIW